MPLKYNIRLLLLISLYFTQLISSEWIYKADLLNAKTINNLETKELVGNVLILKDDITLSTDRAILYSKSDYLELFGKIIMVNDNDTLKCDTLYYFTQNEDYLIASGGVQLTNLEKSISSDSLYYWSDRDSANAIGHVLLNDSLRTLNAGKLNYWITNGYNGYSFHASENVIINDGPNDIKGSEIKYDDIIQEMLITGDASIIRENQKLFGDEININYTDSLINQININGDPIAYNSIYARVTPESKLIYFEDVMNSNSMIISYSNNLLQNIKLVGMANSIYHVVEDSLLKGYNDVTGDTIKLSFVHEDLERMEVFGGGRGTFYPEKNNSNLEGIINYEANSIDYKIIDDENYFYEGAIIKHIDTELYSEFIKINWNNNILSSYKVGDVKPKVKIDSNSNPMVGDTLYYDLVTEKGTIKKGKTELNDAFYHGKEIYSDNEQNIFSYNGLYTSCNLDNPHYYFLCNQMKLIPDKHIIVRPIILHIQDFPILGFPFAILPNKGGKRQSGWIMPSFGYSAANGTYFHNLGYYHVINDYSDVKLLTNFYDRKGFKLNTNYRYKKRYKYTGNFSSILVRDLSEGEDITQIFSNNFVQSWNFKWLHSQTIDPSQSVNINFNYISRNDFYQQTQVGYDVDTRLNQHITSSMNYRKNWKEANNSFSLNLSDSYDLLSENKIPDTSSTVFYRTFTLPNISFNHGARLLFGDGQKWYNSIYYSYNSNFKMIEKLGTYNDNETMKDTISYKNGINHKLTISTSQKILKWVNISPKVYFMESWIYGFKTRNKNEEGIFTTNPTEHTEYNQSFKRRLTFDFSLSANTKLYGIFPAKLFSLEAIRHVISPSISYSYRPDFSESDIWGININYIDFDSDGTPYDYFSESLVPTTPIGKRESFTFKINNDLYGKFKQQDNNYKKSHLLTWNSFVSYNPTYDTFQWSYITSSFRSYMSNNFSMDVSFKHDLYDFDYTENERLHSFSKIPQLVNLNSSLQFSLNGKKISGFEIQNKSSTSEDEFVDEDLEYYTPVIDDSNLWEADFTVRGSRSRGVDQNLNFKWQDNYWMNSNIDINITKNWVASYSMRFDLKNSEITSHNFVIYRPLHCWVFNFKWYPGVGPDNYGNGFQLLIKVKNPDLQDVRLKHTKGNMFGF